MTDPVDRLRMTISDRYAIEREVGAGGMATVYLARDLKHNRRVALKVLRPELAAVLGTERFLAEIQVTANLQHPHLLPLFDSGEADGQLFYVMPFVEGESLRACLERERQLPVEESVRIAVAIASALDYAHRHGVVHRDLKPENILLHEGQPLVADFGIALAVSNAGGARVTQTGISLGTPNYMSPEQATGDRHVDGRSDVYSLAAITYEMLVGDPPHMAGTTQAVIAKLLTERAPRVRSHRDTVPEQVDAAIAKGLAKLPADRFSSASAFASALTDRAFEYGQEIESTGGRPEFRKWKAATATFALVTAVLGVALAWALAKPLPISSAPPGRFQIMLPDDAPLTFSGPAPLGMWQGSLDLTRNGSLLAYVAPEGQSTVLYVRDMATGVVRRLDGTEGAYSPFFSPDGAWIGFFVGFTLRKIRAEGGASVLLRDNLTIPFGGTWLSDGRIYVAESEGAIPTLVPEGGGSVTTVTWAVGTGSLVTPAPLPGGDWVIGTMLSGQLGLLSLEDGELFAITAGGVQPRDSIDPSEMLVGFDPAYVSTGHVLYLSNGDGDLMALPFDGRTREVLGPPVLLASGVRKGENRGFGHFAVDENGVFVYAPGVNAARGYLGFVDSDGTVDTLPFPRQDYNNLRLSRDGTRLLASIRPESGHPYAVHQLELESGRSEPLTTRSALTTWAWGWLPGSDDVLLASTDPVSWEPESTFVYSVGDRAEIRLVESLATSGWLAVHPLNGTMVSSADAEDMVLTVPADGPVLETHMAEDFSQQAFSPDGMWIAARDVTGAIRVAPFPLTGRSFLVTTGREYEQPFWSADGRVLYYKGVREYWKVTFSPTGGSDGGPRFGAPQLVARGPFARVRNWSHDIAPDGRILVVMGPQEQSTDHLEVMTGIFSRLREIAPRVR